MKKKEAQLRRWSVQIDQLAARLQTPGFHAGFDTLTYVDELKALHAIAQSKLIMFKVVEDTRWARLKAEMESAWNDLDAAFKNPIHRRWPRREAER